MGKWFIYIIAHLSSLTHAIGLCNETRLQHIPTFLTNTIIYHAIYRSLKLRKGECLGGRHRLLDKRKDLAGQELEVKKALLGTPYSCHTLT